MYREPIRSSQGPDEERQREVEEYMCQRWFPFSVMRQAQHTGSELVSVNTFMELLDVGVFSSCLLLDTREGRREYKNP